MRLEVIEIEKASIAGRSTILRSAMCAAKHGPAEIVIDRVSRLGRQPAVIMGQISHLRRAGIRIFVRSGENTMIPIDRSVPALLMTLSALEREEISRRTSKAVLSARTRGSSSGRPLVMTLERQAIAARMLSQGKRGPQILKVIRGLGGPNISQSAYYLWQKAWLASDRGVARLPRSEHAALKPPYVA